MNLSEFNLYAQTNSTRRACRSGEALSVTGRGNVLSYRGWVALGVLLVCGGFWWGIASLFH